jgi:hypothetical protein
MKTITNTTENNELQVKENWAKPEVNIFDVKEETLGGAPLPNGDSLTLS